MRCISAVCVFLLASCVTVNGPVTGIKGDVTVNSGDDTPIVVPQISSIVPTNAGPGAEITISGLNFLPTQARPLQVTFNGIVSTRVNRIDDKTLKVTVPNTALNGDIVVSIGGILSNPQEFKVIKSLMLSWPGLDLISPTDSNYWLRTQTSNETKQYTVVARDASGATIANPSVRWEVNGDTFSVNQTGLCSTGAVSSVKEGSIWASSGILSASTSIRAVPSYYPAPIFIGSQQGLLDGVGTDAELVNAFGMSVDSHGSLFFADEGNNCIRKILTNGTTSTFATGLSYPTGLAVDSNDNIYVFEAGRYRVTKFSAQGNKSILAGGSRGSADGQGTAAQFSEAEALTVDNSGNIYVSDTYNTSVRKVTQTGLVTTIAGSSNYGYADGTGLQAKFSYNRGIVVDGVGNLYVVDAGNNAIRKIAPSGLVTTLAGGPNLGSADGIGSAARFDGGYGMTMDPNGNLLVVANNSVRQVSPIGQVTTLPVPLRAPWGIVSIDANTICVSDGCTIRKIKR